VTPVSRCLPGLAVAWLLGAWWVFVPHRFEGSVIIEFTAAHGVHLFDPLGVLLPLALTALVLRHRGCATARHTPPPPVRPARPGRV